MNRAICILIVACAMLGSAMAGAEPVTNRPSAWAQPVELAGAPNLHKVSDTLFRSAQPTADGMRNLKTMGIRTVVNLRSFHSDQDELADTGLDSERIYMKAWHPEWEDVVKFLQIVTDTNRAPFLVHCQHGADRTGTMCAIYRVAVAGWTKEEALHEMTDGGFGFHEVWVNLPPWIRDLDIDSIRNEVGGVVVRDGDGAATRHPDDAVSFGGHFYKVFSGGESWHARARQCESLGGYLACVESADEQAFIARVADGHYLSLGGFDEGREGEWRWINGSPWEFTAWMAGQPNNYGDGENFLATYTDGEWVDVADEGTGFWMPTGYICEWDR